MGPRLLFRAWQGPCDNPSGLGGQGWPDPPPPRGSCPLPSSSGLPWAPEHWTRRLAAPVAGPAARGSEPRISHPGGRRYVGVPLVFCWGVVFLCSAHWGSPGPTKPPA